MDEEDSVFSRWSRRKREAVQPEPTPGPAAVVEPPDTLVEPETEEEEIAQLEKLGLPRPESLSEGDDFTPFMKPGVPEFLRKRALRVLWRSNPVLANLDGLNDYDDDFNAPELNQKVLATGYKVGRGFVKKVVESLEDSAPEPEMDEEDALAAIGDEIEISPTLQAQPAPTFESDAEVDAALRPRRMRFET